MNQTLVFAPTIDQYNKVKKLKTLLGSKGKIIDLRQYQALSLADLYRAFYQDIKKKAVKNKNFIFLYFDLLLPLSSAILNLLSFQDQHKLSYSFCLATNIYAERNFKRLKKFPFLFEKVVFIKVKEAEIIRPKLFLENLAEGQRRVLKLAVRGEASFQPALKPDLEYLLKLGILVKKRKKYQLKFSQLLAAALAIPSLVFSEIELKANKIIVDKQDISSQFSFTQFEVLSLLLKNKGKVVSREQIAEAVWRKGWQDKYSDWAIDKTISGLRKKLKKLWIDPQIIATVKTKGFKLVKKDSWAG